jgi:hypothetical protein
MSLLIIPLCCDVSIADGLAGTWHGTLSGDGDSFEIDVTFSREGNLIFSYTNKNGNTASVEITSVGQQIRYVPPGGGVKTHVVDALSRRTDRLALTIRTSFERTSSGYLDQQFMLESFEFALNPEGLATKYAMQSQSYFSGTGAAASEEQASAAGVLQKVNQRQGG